MGQQDPANHYRLEGLGSISDPALESAVLYWFLDLIESDTRIGTAHIGVYSALWKIWKDKGCKQPLSFYRSELVTLCKLSSFNSYHKAIRQLHEYGYIKYFPSYNHCLGSQVYFTALWDIPKTAWIK